jgi:hypothetical protein
MPFGGMRRRAVKADDKGQLVTMSYDWDDKDAWIRKTS